MSVKLDGAMYENIPEVAGLNSVKGFDPRKFMRRTILEETKEEGFYLDLKFKKLWFRLVHPTGRIKTTALKITNQLAIIEAKVYFDKYDKEPVSSFTAQRTVQGKAGTLYIEAAQYAAADQALCDAGFGLQFCDVSQGADPEQYDSGIPATAKSATGQPLQVEKVSQVTAPQPDPPVEAVRESDPTAAPVAEAVHEPDPPADHVAEVLREPDPPAAPAAEAVHQPVPEEVAAAGIVESPTPGGAEPISEQNGPTPTTVEAAAAMGGEEIVSDAGTARYTPDMPVEEIYALMTPEEAAAVISDVGNMAGQTLGAIAQRRVASLKWYINGYAGSNNILRAGAKIMLEQAMGQQMAS